MNTTSNSQPDITDVRSKILKGVEDAPTPDEFVKAEEKYFVDYADQILKQKQAQLDFESSQFDLEARKKYARWVFFLVVGWIVAVLLLIFISGYPEKEILWGFIGPKISDGVLIALITGLSVNVIALLAIVINHLFPKRSVK